MPNKLFQINIRKIIRADKVFNVFVVWLTRQSCICLLGSWKWVLIHHFLLSEKLFSVRIVDVFVVSWWSHTNVRSLVSFMG